MSPAVDAAESQRHSSRSSSSSSAGGGSSSSSSSRQPRLTVADVIRESIKLKQKNERLRQQLNLRSERSERRSSSSGGGSGKLQVQAYTIRRQDIAAGC
jgi:hypothetical protein